MGHIISFPLDRAREGYDPNAVSYLQLGPPPPPQVTVLGECALTEVDLKLLVKFLQKNPQLWSIRLLDREGSELIAFTGQLPPCAVVSSAQRARVKREVRPVVEEGHSIDDE